MKKYFARHGGFTLIELLIVIALLGALAVGLIGAIDPFEQLKKGSDTGTRDLVSQVQTAWIRYFSVKNAFPGALVSGTQYHIASTTNGTTTIDPIVKDALDQIVAAGELTSDFETVHLGQLNSITITETDANVNNSTTVAVCYTPQSKSFQTDPNTKYNPLVDGSVWSGNPACKSTAGGTKQCSWCIQ